MSNFADRLEEFRVRGLQALTKLLYELSIEDALRLIQYGARLRHNAAGDAAPDAATTPAPLVVPPAKGNN